MEHPRSRGETPLVSHLKMLFVDTCLSQCVNWRMANVQSDAVSRRSRKNGPGSIQPESIPAPFIPN